MSAPNGNGTNGHAGTPLNRLQAIPDVLPGPGVIPIDPAEQRHSETILRLIGGHKVQPRSQNDLVADRNIFGDLGRHILDSVPEERLKAAQTFIDAEKTRRPTDTERLRQAIGSAESTVTITPDEPQPRPEGFDLELIDAQAFLEQVFEFTWLVKGLLVKGQPTIIGGAEKSLKTSFALDLAISLAVGRPFLDKFYVPTATRVLFLSGESGPATLQGNMKEMLASKGTPAGMLGDRLHLGFNLPMLTDAEHLLVVQSELDRVKPEVLIVDPIYLCMGGDESQFDPRNLFKVGTILRTIDRICTDRGVTLILVHHFRQRADPYSAPDLSDLSYAGFAQWLRQRIFLSRRSEYQNDGHHAMRLDYGGSFGHQGRCEVDVNTGIIDGDFRGRKWEVVVRAMPEAIARQEEQRETERARRYTEAREKVSRATEANATEVLNILKSWPKDRPPVKSDLVAAAKLSGADFNRALEFLRATENVEVRMIPRVKAAGPKEVEAVYLKPKFPRLGHTLTDSDEHSDELGLRHSDTHSDETYSPPVGGSRSKEECVSSEQGIEETEENQDSDKNTRSVEEGDES